MGGDTTRRYRAHGLSIVSDLDLPAFSPVAGGHEVEHHVDLTIVTGPPPIDVWTASGPSSHVPIASDDTAGRRLRIVQTVSDEGWEPGWWLADAEGIRLSIGPDGDVMYVDVDAGAESAVGWFVGGAGLAMVLAMRGEIVVHASLIELDGAGILLVAPSGHGKSVTSAAAVAGGARLVAEDTVRLHRGSAGWIGHRGSSVVRLRRGSGDVGALFPDAVVAESSDGRRVVDLGGGDANARLGAIIDLIVFVALDPAASTGELVEIDPTTTLMSMLGQLRVPGIVSDTLLDAHFAAICELANDVAPVMARLPWTGDLSALGAAFTMCVGFADGLVDGSRRMTVDDGG